MEFKESSNSSVEMQLDQSKNTLDKQIDKVFHIKSNFDDTFKELNKVTSYLYLTDEQKTDASEPVVGTSISK